LSWESENREPVFRRLVELAQTRGKKILACYFAKPEKQKHSSKLFNNFVHAIDSEIEIEDADESRFEEQMKNHNVFFFNGGYPHKLFDAVEGKDLSALARGENVVFGLSSGAMLMSQCTISGYGNEGEIMYGRGYLPFAVHVHSDEWPESLYSKLKAEVAGRWPIMRLREYDWTEVEV